MSLEAPLASPVTFPRPSRHLLAVATATVLALGIHLFGLLVHPAGVANDNDSMMRLVQVRDLIAGQAWFDLTQYRMGLDGGFEMHWSRLVDAPIALLVLLGQAASGSALFGETLAAIIWPSLLFAAALSLIVHGACRLAGKEAFLPALVLGGITLHGTAIFRPGALDHHNIQVVLVLAMVTALMAHEERLRLGLAAGAAAAFMIAIGMEALPLAAAGAAVTALFLLSDGSRQKRYAAGFGLAFALGACALLAVTVAPSRWLEARCDALSLAQALPAALGGLGLAGLACLPAAGRSFALRLGGLAVLGLALVAVIAGLFPGCASDPYAGLDPRLREMWLGYVAEAQSIADLAAGKPDLVPRHYATPALAFLVLGLAAWRQPSLWRSALAAGLPLGVAFLISLWQVRGAQLALPLAAIPLAAMVAVLRRRARADPRLSVQAAMIAGWLISLPIVWGVATLGAASMLAGESGSSKETEAQSCDREADFEQIVREPPATVLAISNLGPALLRYTHHRVLAGPYHRNEAGNLATLDILLAEPKDAQRLMAKYGVSLVVHCPGNDETGLLVAQAPHGLIAALVEGRVPHWLQPLAGEDGSAPIIVYRLSGRTSD
jgi:hypothetical protein